ncbi:hypothetical protein G7B40_033360 [Aetokthonos hydrillicola Thurmond2011]|jgi:hypothetical protein|uniref:DUF551 domain-containing protein n=1 Tax=Aetokthonos hydrillicola Thurmond2011 TaxID=2712845 RepID=A0AAP5IGI7_9CYAN|nr:hypothetical protein [Aetokthonos hydrillicola]MBO3459550.1 hypothetical protein [Aetokthonos hydrillicola CCALA 1050]MBW4590299.1 hypothetical protein [Aetokthonos hydrillicola CCALA 1050]MDR9899413.1 hypothetical protein [Aetokthonos hydrillicola Thurmond2011]
MSNWIEAKKTLPNEGEMIWVTTRSRDLYIAMLVKGEFVLYSLGRGRTNHVEILTPEQVVAWTAVDIPLPPPPKR